MLDNFYMTVLLLSSGFFAGVSIATARWHKAEGNVGYFRLGVFLFYANLSCALFWAAKLVA